MTMLDGVRINQLSDEATTWLAGMLRALDAKDVDAYTHLHGRRRGGRLQQRRNDHAGREQVRDGLAKFWQSFGSLQHEELNIYGTDRHLVHER